MLLIDFSSRGWESWDLERQPLIREGMPVLVDDDLRFEDGPGDPRPTVAVNRWLRELVRAENPVTVSEQHVPGGRPRPHRPDESQQNRLLWPSDSST